MQTVRIHRAEFGRCPYLPNRTWETDSFSVRRVDPGVYENLLGDGWRRSGTTFYRNHCPGCRACIPIRIPVGSFRPSKKQRRIVRLNADLSCSLVPGGYRDESYQLYWTYVRERHGREFPPSRDSYREFLCEGSVPQAEMHYRLSGKLIGVGWLDILPGGLSSVYFAFDPQHAKRSLGLYSIMRELEEVRRRGHHWYYLGFYVPGSTSMDYKARFFPHQLLLDSGRWTQINDRDELTKTIAAWNPFTRPVGAPRSVR